MLEFLTSRLRGILDYMSGADLLPDRAKASEMLHQALAEAGEAGSSPRASDIMDQYNVEGVNGVPPQGSLSPTRRLKAKAKELKAKVAGQRRKQKKRAVRPLSVTVEPVAPGPGVMASTDFCYDDPEAGAAEEEWEVDDARWTDSNAEVEALAAVRLVLGEELRMAPPTRAMFRAFGGEPRCLMRYLRLHKLKPAAAAAALQETLAFRQEQGLDAAGGIQLEPSLLARVLTHWCCAYGPSGPDGSPTLYWKLSAFEPGAMFAGPENGGLTEAEFTQFFCFWMEQGLMKQREALRSGLTPPGVVEIYDLAGVSLGQMMSGGTKTLGGVLGLGQKHYPENLTRGYLINAPWFFARGFAMVKPLLNESTIEQLRIHSVRLHILRHARIKTVGKSESCMVSGRCA